MDLIRWHARCRDFVKRHLNFASNQHAEEKFDPLFTCDQVNDGAGLQHETISRWLNMLEQQGQNLPDVQIICRQLRPYVTGYPIDRDRTLCIAACDAGMEAGWFPSNAREGDQLCQFTGAPYPFLVRPQGAGYVLLGDAFVADMSEAEALGLDHREWKYRLDEVRICDGALKMWMQSKERKEFKREKQIEVDGWDARKKCARKDALDDLGDLYREGDAMLDWIHLT